MEICKGEHNTLFSMVYQDVYTAGFLRKLIKRCDLANTGHKHDLLLETFEYGVYQNNKLQCKQTHG